MDSTEQVPGTGFEFNLEVQAETINPHEAAIFPGGEKKRIYWDGKNIFFAYGTQCGPRLVTTPDKINVLGGDQNSGGQCEWEPSVLGNI
ncbi:hypothetical protein [Corynebacterium heidelbergense]|uniref:hypothetical protein n=1 Tax=Corynebacterium heidelbergense TaxID=2055947 RepID=UPI0011BDD857|nr:hypothetical protein [Corynebacterium heidelbergense]